ncbi:hypothetical protein, partial [Lysinibacillus sp. NPDC096215]|uniref:hypothetical protein n=1 Tax=Lysinibacillus sp. NPDC096215 TaxID=3390582 RepID=UPI003D0676FA
MSRLGQQMFFARKRSGSSTMLVTKALSQDVTILAFVPLICSLQGLICDAESPRSHSVYTPINRCSSYFLLA